MQRYACDRCGKSFSETQPLDGLRIETKQVEQVVNLLVEGVGIRACERLTNLNRRTVLGILQTAGQKCAELLDHKIRNLQVRQLQTDEVWAFVGCKALHTHPLDMERGDQYTFLTFDRDTKLIVNHLVGKRTRENCQALMGDLKSRIVGKFQLSTDGFSGYTRENGAVLRMFGFGIDYGWIMKMYGRPTGLGPERRYSPPVCLSVEKRRVLGNPDPTMICTSHVERQNLNVRIFNRRFTRLTLGFSKKLENLKHSVSLLVAYHNFCRIHSAHKLTPAQAAGLTDHQWTVAELLESAI